MFSFAVRNRSSTSASRGLCVRAIDARRGVVQQSRAASARLSLPSSSAALPSDSSPTTQEQPPATTSGAEPSTPSSSPEWPTEFGARMRGLASRPPNSTGPSASSSNPSAAPESLDRPLSLSPQSLVDTLSDLLVEISPPSSSSSPSAPSPRTDHTRYRLETDTDFRYASTAQPTPGALRMAKRLVLLGAPDVEELHPGITEGALRRWIDKAREAVRLPPTTAQLALAKNLIAQGAPDPHEVREGMTHAEMERWLTKAQIFGNFIPGRMVPVGHARRTPASGSQLDLAKNLSDASGLPIPYDPRTARKGEVSNFIIACRTELARQSKPVFVPRPGERDMPATERQKLKLERMGLSLPWGATRGQASDMITQRQKEMGVAWGLPEVKAAER
ncbi:hypothetical protein CALCODRAFT_514021 [Calocera cornea HHB12733]|uniref:Uncharacterized protein n=1 Tax=Calocera cornea HHB12733 TaxID=1353952 RepID=A0A165JZY3_9BASI|nr:hypothetical protein CALCODRAFT_514021 [Calocera cornea HHB12733]